MAKSKPVRNLQQTRSKKTVLWVPGHCLEHKVVSPSMHNSLTETSSTPPKMFCAVELLKQGRAGKQMPVLPVFRSVTLFMASFVGGSQDALQT